MVYMTITLKGGGRSVPRATRSFSFLLLVTVWLVRRIDIVFMKQLTFSTSSRSVHSGKNRWCMVENRRACGRRGGCNRRGRKGG